MSDTSENFVSQAAALQRLWLTSMSKAMHAAFAATPGSASAGPGQTREVRDAVLEALAEGWDEYLRSPQFQDGMKDWMERVVAVRKMSNDLIAKTRQEMQAPTTSDIDSLLMAIRHLETRILDRLEDLSGQLHALEERLDKATRREAKPRRPATKRTRRPATGNVKPAKS